MELVLLADHVRPTLSWSDDGSTVDRVWYVRTRADVLSCTKPLCAANLLPHRCGAYSGNDLSAGDDHESLHGMRDDCLPTLVCTGSPDAIDPLYDGIHDLFRRPMQHVRWHGLMRGRDVRYPGIHNYVRVF